MGVPPHRQEQGIGSARVREAADRMRKQGAAGIFLVGDPGSYTRLGCKKYLGVTYAGVPPQYVPALQLGDAAPYGEIVAYAAFSLAAPDQQRAKLIRHPCKTSRVLPPVLGKARARGAFITCSINLRHIRHTLFFAFPALKFSNQVQRAKSKGSCPNE